MFEFYQNLPQHIDSIAFSIGSFEIRWYSLMWIVGIGVSFFVLDFLKRKELENKNLKIKNQNDNLKFKKTINDFAKLDLYGLFFYLTAGILAGGRLGYVLFYNFPYYLNNLLEIFLPFQLSSSSFQFTGFYGMSYYGAFVGAIFSGYLFARKYRMDFWQLADFVSVAIPAGYFFGRIGNFLNGELYGRPTDSFLGMYFSSGGGVLRHPSQLYEAFFEGLVLFLILFWARRYACPYVRPYARPYVRFCARAFCFPGSLFLAYIFGYSFLRFFLEFFREPDSQIGFIFGIFTLGQIFSIISITAVWGLFSYFHNKDKVI